MSLFKKLKKIYKNPYKIFMYISKVKYSKYIPDYIYLKLIYRGSFGKKLDISKPKTYNEKLQWLKLHDRKDMYTQLVDKLEVRKYISENIGEEYLIPLLGVYNSFDEINFEELPKQFVLKCTHDSGGLIICKDKNKLDIDSARKKINKCLKQNYYYMWREWPYKNIKPKIICEKYMEEKSGKEIKDYKFMCFNENPKLIQYHQNRSGDYTLDFFDIDWNRTSLVQGVPNSNNTITKPHCIEEMLKIVNKLAKNTYFVRIDMYYINNKVYFGEITYYPTSGLTPFENENDDVMLGEWISLPIS